MKNLLTTKSKEASSDLTTAAKVSSSSSSSSSSLYSPKENIVTNNELDSRAGQWQQQSYSDSCP